MLNDVGYKTYGSVKRGLLTSNILKFCDVGNFFGNRKGFEIE